MARLGTADVVAIALQESTTSMIGRGPRADLSVRTSSLEAQASNTDDADETVATTGKSSGTLKQVFGRLLPNHEIVCDASRGQMRLFVFVRAPLAGGCALCCAIVRRTLQVPRSASPTRIRAWGTS